MPHRPLIHKDLIIIPTLIRLVPKKVNMLEALLCDVLQGIRLVPSLREDVKGDLAADRVGQAVVWELGAEG